MTSLRLLVPVGSASNARGGVRYAARRQDAGGIDVCLLHVEEPVNQWQLLRTADAHDARRRVRAERTLAAVADELGASGIPATAFVRAGSVVFTILDAAEQLDCDEIVVPRPRAGWRRLFSRDIVATLVARQRGIPVVVVDGDGEAAA